MFVLKQKLFFSLLELESFVSSYFEIVDGKGGREGGLKVGEEMASVLFGLEKFMLCCTIHG